MCARAKHLLSCCLVCVFVDLGRTRKRGKGKRDVFLGVVAGAAAENASVRDYKFSRREEGREGRDIYSVCHELSLVLIV